MRKSIRILLILLTAVLFFWFCQAHGAVIRDMLEWKPDSLIAAAVVILLCYAVKSVLVFVPIMIVQIAAGHFFSQEAALLINTLGLAIVMAVPYWIGKAGGTARMERIMRRYPKVAHLVAFQHENEMAACFMLRACAVPPADVVTMYLGATNIHFSTNVVGGVLGCFPCMVLTTLLGANIRDPGSPAFWQMVLLNIAWVALSALSYWLFQHFHSSSGKEDRT